MDANVRPTLGWTLSAGCGAAPQTGFRVGLADTEGRSLWRSVLIRFNLGPAYKSIASVEKRRSTLFMDSSACAECLLYSSYPSNL